MNEKPRTPNQHHHGGGITLPDLYHVIFRHKWAILLLTIGGIVAAGIIHYTAPTDYVSEAQLKERIRKFGEHKTMIIVTHRSSLMDLADRIIVLDDGVVVADGPKEKVIAALQAGQVTRAA